MKSFKSRFISFALALLMTLSLFPAVLMPVTEVQAANGSQFDDFIHMDAEPEGYDPNSTNNPYGYGVGQPFLLVEQNELLLYQISDMDQASGSRAWTTYYEGFNKGKVTDSVAEGNLNVAVNSWSEHGSFTGYGTFADTKADCYVTAAAFDATGSGRRDHVAYVAYNYSSKKMVSWVQDTRQHNRQTETVVLDSVEWMANAEGENGVGQYEATNFLTVTAGDYDGDGIETFVLYIPGDNHGYGLIELQLTSNFTVTYKSVKEPVQTYLHANYLNNASFMAFDNNTRNKLSVALASGDFDGDGIDDLAVLSYINRPTGSHQGYNSSSYASQVTAVRGVKGGGTILSNKAHTSTFVRQVSKVENGKTYYNSMIAPGLAVGDVDGDGLDEIVVAGVKNTIRTKANEQAAEAPYDINNNKFSVAVFNPVPNLSDFALNDIDTTAWHRGGFYPSGDDVWQQIKVETVAIDGKAAAEYVFIQGGLYQVSVLDGSLTEKLIPSYFKSQDSGAGGSSIGVTYIASVASGNFDDNEAGREQVVFVIGLREPSATAASDYYYRLGIIGGNEYEDTADSYGIVKNFYANDIDKGDYFIANKGDKMKQKLNALVVAIDRDNDGMMGKYKGMEYAYSDPTVLAALQAAPWFEELGSWGDFSGETSYGFSQSYGFSKVKTKTQSFGIGVSVDLQFAVGLKVAFEEGYTGEWSKSFEESLVESYASTFTAGPYDTVVLYRTPMVMYLYDLMVDGEWTENAVGITIPQQPSYIQLAVDDYNAFVEYYNAYAAAMNAENPDKLQIEMLNILADDYLGNEGNPWGYRNSWAGTDATSLSKTSYSLGHASGQTTSTYSYEGSETTGFEDTHGYQLSLTVQGGGSVAGNEAWAGVATEFAASTGYGEYTTVANGTETSGTVFDINKYLLFAEQGIPLSTSEAYKFNWTFGKWAFNPGGASNSKTPILGYALTGLRAPVPHPNDLSASLNPDDAAGSVILTWKKPDDDNRLKASGYNIYQKNDKGGFDPVNAEPLPADARTFTVLGLDSNTEYTYLVKATSDESVESISSNQESIRTAKKNYTIIFDLNENNVTVDAKHVGNLTIKSGDLIPEDNIVYLKLAPKEKKTITRVELEVNGSRRDITNVSHEYNFLMQGDTTVYVASEVIPSLSEFEIEYADRYEDPDESEIGRVGATAAGHPFASGATVFGPVEFTAAPAEGYVLEKWMVTTGVEITEHMANGKNVWLFEPYAASHKVEARFVKEDDPSVNRSLAVKDMEGGALLINGERVNDEILTLGVGTQVTLLPDPDPQYSFKNWTDDLSSYGSSADAVSLTLLDDMTVGADFFAPVRYSVTFAAVNSGAGSGELTASSREEPITSGAQLLPFSNIVFEAKTHAGSRLDKWSITRGTTITEIPVDGLVTKDVCQIENLQSKYFVQAYFKEIEEYALAIHLEGDGAVSIMREGTELADGDPIFFGDVLTITAVPADGALLGSLLVNGTVFEPGSSLTVDRDVRVDAGFVEKSDEDPFIDVPSQPVKHWAYDYVINLYNQGIIKGYGSSRLFKPDNPLTRYHAAKMIARAAGLDFEDKIADFPDVDPASEYSPYIAALAEKGAISGFRSDGSFRGDENIKRSHVAKILVLAFGLKEGSLEVEFPDLPDDPALAEYIMILASNGIVSGIGATGEFRPDAEVTRAQFSKMVVLCQAVAAVQNAEMDKTAESVQLAGDLVVALSNEQDLGTKIYLEARLDKVRALLGK